MNQITQLKLESNFRYHFFSKCGTPLPKSVVSAADWSDAVTHGCSRKWENCGLMARNVLQHLSELRSSEMSSKWNSTVKELRVQVEGFVTRLGKTAPVPEHLFCKIAPILSWDILFMCMEKEYSVIVQPVFYLPLLEPWYSAGHFPCGWDGPEFPEGWDGVIREGRLIVF